MDADFKIALQLLLVGMVTVFAILFLVVITGNLLIRFVNKFAATPEPVLSTTPTPTKTTAISSEKMAVIVSAVQQVTQGKGQVTTIKKIN